MSDLSSLIQGGPSGGAAAAPGKYIGVPDDYVAPSMDQRFPGSVGTPGVRNAFQLYKEGDQYGPFVGRSVADIAAMQQDLVDAGLIAKGTAFRLGVADKTTVDAYKKALEYANQQGMEASRVIEQFKQAPVMDMSTPNTLQYQLPNRDDIKAIAGKSARAALGRPIDEATKERIAVAYEQEMMRLQQQQFQNQAVDGAKNYQAPDAGLYALQQVRAQNPGETRAHDYANTYQQFTSLIGSSAADAREGL